MEHTEQIECPECNTIQWAKVEHTIPFWTKIHDCINCGFKIMESEWNEAKLSPKITHISCDKPLSNETIIMLNRAVEIAYNLK